jgi:hypothetical protein
VEGMNKIDVIKVLGYIKHHLADNGYAVYGDFFEEEGEIAVLEELIRVYGLKIEESENIQKNIVYA